MEPPPSLPMGNSGFHQNSVKMGQNNMGMMGMMGSQGQNNMNPMHGMSNNMMCNSTNFNLRSQMQVTQMQQSTNAMGMRNQNVNAERRKRKQNLMDTNMIQSARLGQVNALFKLPLLKADTIQRIKLQLAQHPLFWWINIQNYQGIFKYQEFSLQTFSPQQNILQNYHFVQKTKFFMVRAGEIEVQGQDKTFRTGDLVDLSTLTAEKGIQVISKGVSEVLIYDKAAISGFLKQISLMNFNQMQSILQNVKIFNGMPKRIVEHLAFEFSIVQYPTGSKIITENAPNNHFFVLIQGNVGFYRKGILYKMMAEYQFVGENMLNNFNESFTCVCESECKLLQISREQINEKKNFQLEMKKFSFYN